MLESTVTAVSQSVWIFSPCVWLCVHVKMFPPNTTGSFVVQGPNPHYSLIALTPKDPGS